MCFLDSDDWYEPDFCETMVNEAEKSKADIVQCGFKRGDRTTFTLNETISKKDLLKAYVGRRHISVYLWNKIYRKHIWDDIRIPVQYFAEDSVAILECLHRAQRVELIEYVGYHYGIDNSDSLVRGERGPKTWAGYVAEAQAWEKFFTENAPELRCYADEKYCTRAQYGISDLRRNTHLDRKEREYWRKQFFSMFRAHWKSYRRSEAYRLRRKSRQIGTALFSVAPDLYVRLWPLAKKIFG